MVSQPYYFFPGPTEVYQYSSSLLRERVTTLPLELEVEHNRVLLGFKWGQKAASRLNTVQVHSVCSSSLYTHALFVYFNVFFAN